MSRHLGKAPFVVVALFATVANSSRFNPAVMPVLSVAMFIAMALVLWFQYRREGAVSAIGQGMLAYLAVNAAGFTFLPASLGLFLTHYLTGTLYLIFLALAFLPALIAGRYFTEYFAKKAAPEAVWETTPFKTINRNMTYGWSAIFAIAACLAAIPALAGWTGPTAAKGVMLAVRLFFQVVLPLSLVLAVGVPFTKCYPKYHMRKLGIELPGTQTELESPKEPREMHMEGGLKVVAVNGSPKGPVGNTSIMIKMVGEALSSHGIALTEIFLSEKHIEYCMGCAYCLEKNRCWRNDDHADLLKALKEADGIILASPVYFGQVTAQMKTFLDRALSHGHKPSTGWKPGLAISVSAGKGESETARYLARVLHPFGAFPVGELTAIAVRPGDFTGIENVRSRAHDLARDLAVAIKEKRRYPVTDEDLSFYLFMRELVTANREFMSGDYDHWRGRGLLESFEAYTGQSAGKSAADLTGRAEWIKEMMREEAGKRRGEPTKRSATGPGKFTGDSCRELLFSMPLAFKADVAGDLKAVYQFEISGGETFSGYLEIADGVCRFHEGRAASPQITITTPSEVWLSIAKGDLNGQSAFMAGKFKVQGDMGLLMRMKNLFG